MKQDPTDIYYRSVKACGPSEPVGKEDATHAILHDPSGYDPVRHGPPFFASKTAEFKPEVQTLMRKEARGGTARIAKLVSAQLDGFKGLLHGELGTLLVFLRAVGLIHQTNHWGTVGPNGYALHQLFDRLYGGVVVETDSLAERLVGLADPSMVEPVRLSKQTAEVVEELSAVGSFGSNMVETSLVAEVRFLLLLQALSRTLRESGVLSPGTDNLLAGIADKHEEHVYLLKQSLSPSKA